MVLPEGAAWDRPGNEDSLEAAVEKFDRAGAVSWPVRPLEWLGNDEAPLVASGKPVGIFRTHADAPRVLIADANLVGQWSNWDESHRLERMGLTMYGQMTAGSWIYIGSQGIVQGTFQ